MCQQVHWCLKQEAVESDFKGIDVLAKRDYRDKTMCVDCGDSTNYFGNITLPNIKVSD